MVAYMYCLSRLRAVSLGLLNLVVNVRDTPRVGDKLAILTRNIERGRRGSIGWLRRRNFVSSGQSQIGGLPIGVTLEGGSQNSLSHTRRWRNRDSKPRSLSRHREGELKRGSLEKRSLTRDRGFESLHRRVSCEPGSNPAKRTAPTAGRPVGFEMQCTSGMTATCL